MDEKTNNPAEWAGFVAPDGETLAWRVVRPDGRSKYDFKWPFKGIVEVPKSGVDSSNNGACPSYKGDGICLARSWNGAASGMIPAITGLAVSYREEDVLGSEPDKLRVVRCRVLGPIDIPRLLREGEARGADLRGANLYGANLYGADLRGADLRGANLYGADLRGANLYGANLHGANLYGANLRGANLYGANLYGANLRGANLYGADLRGANLYRADLRGANLRGANLYGADLRGANLYRADLRGADLRGANLYGARNLPDHIKKETT